MAGVFELVNENASYCSFLPKSEEPKVGGEVAGGFVAFQRFVGCLHFGEARAVEGAAKSFGEGFFEEGSGSLVVG